MFTPNRHLTYLTIQLISKKEIVYDIQVTSRFDAMCQQPLLAVYCRTDCKGHRKQEEINCTQLQISKTEKFVLGSLNNQKLYFIYIFPDKIIGLYCKIDTFYLFQNFWLESFSNTFISKLLVIVSGTIIKQIKIKLSFLTSQIIYQLKLLKIQIVIILNKNTKDRNNFFTIF